MPIPNADLAYSPPKKLSEYLLNDAHPVGGDKARWFESLGYRFDDPFRLATDLLAVLRASSDFSVENAPFGIKYEVRGKLNTPSGAMANVITVWIVESGTTQPRLVTAYPGRKTQ